MFVHRFFKNAVKVGSSGCARKSLFNSTMCSMNSEDSVSVKSVNMKRVLKEKVNNEQDYYVLSSDSEDEGDYFPSSCQLEHVGHTLLIFDFFHFKELTKKPLKQIARIKPTMTPSVTKKVSVTQ